MTFAHVHSMGLSILQIHRQFHMSIEAWSMEIDHPSPMLIQWAMILQNPSSISCHCLVLVEFITFAYSIQWGYDPSNPSSILMSTGAWSIELTMILRPC
jgi:hypothetical protein